jgi:hypothetical protein
MFYVSYSMVDSKTLSADRLYALKLDRPPDEKDWDDAVAIIVTAKNGNLHRVHKSVDVDKDSVHTTSRSCHHAEPIAPPVKIMLKAYYTDEEIFLRASWSDMTKDDSMFEFTYSDDRWNVSDKLEDAFGIMWDLSEGHEPFNCSLACHTTDWKLKDYNIISKFKMGTVGAGEMDLWNWKASRTNNLNFADDKYIYNKGIIPDTPSKIYFYNSELKGSMPLNDSARDITPLEDGDSPVYDHNGLLIKDGYWMITGTAPGVRVSMPSGKRADVRVHGEYKNSVWEVTFKRKLISEDSKDVTFVVKRTNIYKFGIAVMDNTLTNHYAVEEPVELEFIEESS